MSRITIKDVAHAAGVSPSAVSRVFTEGASASRKTKAKVRDAAERLGYRPSLLARGLVGDRTNLVTLVMGQMSDPFDTLFLDRFADALSERGTRLLMASAKSASPSESALLQALDYQSDAVVVAAGTMSLEHSELCVKAGLPLVLAGRVMDGPGVDCVLADNCDGGRQAAELLHRTACRTVAFLGRGGSTFSDRERYRSFMETARALGLTLLEQETADRGDDAAFKSASMLLSRRHRPDGIFCSNDGIALQAIEAARALGLSIPQEVSIIGFNNIPQAAWRSYRLTTLGYPVDAVVEGIFRLLDSRFADKSRASEVIRIPANMRVRGTTKASLTSGEAR